MSDNHSIPPGDSQDLAHPDDAIIGRAFKISGVILLALLVTGGVAVWLLNRPKPKPETRMTQLAAPVVPAAPKAEVPVMKFTDVTRESGITFVHQTGAYGEKLLPETMGSGLAFFDYDDDDAPDLLFINATTWPWKTTPGSRPTTAALYHNDGKGHFTDVTAGSGLDVPLYGMGVACGDFDNDGRVDVFISTVGGGRLFRNLGAGKFQDVTADAGVAGESSDWSTACAWIDYDNDGRLDLFVANYVRWSREIDAEVGYKLTGLGRAYGPPMNFEGAFPRLYHNEGGGRFRDVSEAAGIRVRNPATGVAAAKALGVAPVDINGDGFIDLVVANDTVQNFVFMNRGDGTFQEWGAAMGVAFDSYGATRGAMGIDAARYRNDETLGIAIGNFANEMTALFASQRSPTNFVDEAITEGIGPASRRLLKFGVLFLDYDLDGWLDLVSANGHLEDEIHKVQESQHYAQPAQLFWNGGGRQTCFLEASAAHAGTDLFKPIVGRGVACADTDGDGDLDLVFTQTGGSPLLLRNDQQLGHHWLRLKLVGNKSNRDAIGAWVRVTAGGVTQWRQVMPTRGYLSQSELTLTFGLGQETRVSAVEVRWPDGSRQPLSDLKTDALNVVWQP